MIGLGRGGHDVDDEQLGVAVQRGVGGQAEIAGLDLGADLQALDRDLDLVRDGRDVGLDLEGVELLADRSSPGAAAPVTTMVDVDDDLLTAADDQEVDVLDVGADRVLHDRLGQRQLRGARDVERDDRVAALLADDPLELQLREREVLRVGAVPVQDGGDLDRRGGCGGRRPCRTPCGSRRRLRPRPRWILLDQLITMWTRGEEAPVGAGPTSITAG